LAARGRVGRKGRDGRVVRSERRHYGAV